jgi:hypothetical protein
MDDPAHWRWLEGSSFRACSSKWSARASSDVRPARVREAAASRRQAAACPRKLSAVSLLRRRFAGSSNDKAGAPILVSGSTIQSLSRARAYGGIARDQPLYQLSARQANGFMRSARPRPSARPCAALRQYAASRSSRPCGRARSTPLRTDGNARAHCRASPLRRPPGPVRRGRGRTRGSSFGRSARPAYPACSASFAGCASVAASALLRFTAAILPRRSSWRS